MLLLLYDAHNEHALFYLKNERERKEKKYSHIYLYLFLLIKIIDVINYSNSSIAPKLHPSIFTPFLLALVFFRILF